tara:strand:+ start:6724 stop:7182 length:459 start_codon:yes stop_codon:yes gene_type:complete
MEVAEMTWYNLFFWLLASILKFVVTPSAMIASGHSAWTTWAVTASGSALGVLTFWRFGTWWFQWLEERMGPRPSRGKRIFNPRRRRIVKMKNLFGLRGLLLASGLISVPLAAALGAKYFRSNMAAKYFLVLAFALWAALLTTASWLLKQGVA